MSRRDRHPSRCRELEPDADGRLASNRWIEHRRRGPPWRAIVPRERFCALAKGGSLVVAPARDDLPGGEAQDAAAGFPLASMAGAKTLIAEACP